MEIEKPKDMDVDQTKPNETTLTVNDGEVEILKKAIMKQALMTTSDPVETVTTSGMQKEIVNLSYDKLKKLYKEPEKS